MVVALDVSILVHRKEVCKACKATGRNEYIVKKQAQILQSI